MPGSINVTAWSLRTENGECSKELHADPVSEVRLSNDNRVPVEKQDFHPDGKYRCTARVQDPRN